MSAAQVRAAVERAFRDSVDPSLPVLGKQKPDKGEIRYALGELLESTLAGIGTGMLKYATVALRDAATGIVTGSVGYVFKNAGSVSDAANGYYQKTDAGWEAADWLDDLFSLNADEIAKVNWAINPADLIDYSDIDYVISNEVVNRNYRSDGDGFTGFGLSFTTPGAIAFNAVSVPAIQRAEGSTDKWQTIQAVVRTHATDSGGASATVVAVGEINVDPDSDALDGLLIPLRDPTTGVLMTVDETDLDATFLIGFQAKNAGGNATAGDTAGTVSGATRLLSYYVTAAGLEAGPWTTYSGNPSLAIGVALLSGLVQEATYQASPALRESLGLPTAPTILRRPGPSEIIMTPRWYGMRGYPGSIYLDGLTTGLGPKLFDFAGGTGLGRHQDNRWYWDPILGADQLDLTISVMDPEHLALHDRKTTSINVVEADAADGEARTLTIIGDSNIEFTYPTARIVSRVAANANGAQITLQGTGGSGANRHDGIAGFSFDRFFQSFGADVALNPYVENDGDKFNASYYLSSTGYAAPDIAGWALGTNPAFPWMTEEDVNARMSQELDHLERMIGVTPDASVVSWKEASAGIKTLIFTPIGSASSQTGFGAGTGYIGQNYPRFKRNIGIAAQRMIERFGGAEADGIFLVPWHVTVDPINGFAGSTDPIHVTPAGGNEMGDQAYYAINVLIAQSLL